MKILSLLQRNTIEFESFLAIYVNTSVYKNGTKGKCYHMTRLQIVEERGFRLLIKVYSCKHGVVG